MERRGKVRTRGGAAGRGNQPRGRQRPSASEIFQGTIDSIPSGSGLERPLTGKKKRILPEKVVINEDDPIWNTIIVPPDQPRGGDVENNEEPPHKKTNPSEYPEEIICELWINPPSPAVHVECGGSGGSTPQSVTMRMDCSSGGSTPRTPMLMNSSGGTTPRAPSFRRIFAEKRSKRPLNFPLDDEQPPTQEERASDATAATGGEGMASTSATTGAATRSLSRKVPRQKTLNDEEISTALCLPGSESESSDDDFDDGEGVKGPSIVQVPRTAQIFFEDLDDVTTNMAHIDLQWPPSVQPRRSPTPPRPETPAPALAPEIVSEAAPASVPSVAELLHGPTDKFHFEWTGFPTVPVPPELRREPFVHVPTGPTASYDAPYDAFTAIWDMDIMNTIAFETNEYAQVLAKIMLKENTMCPNSRINKWRDTDADELYVYFGILLAMGITYKANVAEYWSVGQDIISTPKFSATMPIDRFLLLSRCLHFSSALTPGLQLLTSSEAKVFKIKPIIEHLNKKFSSLYNLGQNIALDESLTMWKGWLDIKQFISNKAASVGIKTYEVCESQTGYLWRFEVHTSHGPSNTESPITGIIPALVLRLLSGLEYRGHTVWMDNYYNSPALARELKTLGFDCVGTLRTDRQLVPDQLTKLTKQQMSPGQVVGCTSGDVDLVVWRDKNRVALISTYHGVATTTCSDHTKPTIVHDYNICMGGVDRKDQMISLYPIERKRTNVWYKKFFRRLLNVSVLNAYILFKSQHGTITHRNFRKTLMNELLKKHAKIAAFTATPLPISGHFPALYDFVAVEPGKRSDRHRARCQVCKKRVTCYCRACNVALCPFVCFAIFEHQI